MLTVIGLGNFLKGDDAIGPVVIEKLGVCLKDIEIKLIDAGADAISVLDYLVGKDPVILIDCAKMGKKPGEVVRFDVTDANLAQVYHTISLHGFSFGDVYKMAGSLGPVAPCKIIGIEPKQFNFNAHLSNEVEASIPEIINLVMLEVEKYAKKNIDN